ncbi:phosphotransferase [Mycolicibacterium hodleri]|uniref:DUF1679 domain-containing protein n=1 Tax=Mycolicibacterium hodleri TaxID=49897 RepID=A0A502EFG8_9MYCO|nr:phosphotransferase [Mycolicibacterium hodleri]TPG36463.1 DUF1679 domain-containing protein [Mycolicibacterium hodleri]
MTSVSAAGRTVIPQSVDDVTADWLSDVLRCEVAAVDVVDVIGGTATKIVLSITYAGPTSLPSRMCLKAGMGDHAPLLAQVGIYAAEARYFRDEAQNSRVRAPEVYWADLDAEECYGAILIEDLSRPTVRFGAAAVPLTLDEAASGMENLALLHASRWNSPWLDSAGWLEQLADPESKSHSYFHMQDAAIVGAYLSKPLRKAVVPAELNDAQRSIDLFWAFIGVAREGPQTLLHGDTHIGNVYLESGAVGLCDWQTARRGSPAFDVAYLLGSSLEPDVRRSAEKQLLSDYLGVLVAEGVGAPPSLDEMWHHYRTHMPYGYFAWLTNREEFQPEETTAITLGRLACAVVDLGSASALGV